jgi:hypothetical protein
MVVLHETIRVCCQGNNKEQHPVASLSCKMTLVDREHDIHNQ